MQLLQDVYGYAVVEIMPGATATIPPYITTTLRPSTLPINLYRKTHVYKTLQ